MITRRAFVDEARTWIDTKTPWRHNAQTKGIGCDCAGLIRGVMIGVGMMPANTSQWPGASRFSEYGLNPDGKTIIEVFDLYFTRIPSNAMQIADVIVIAVGTFPQHMGILADYRHGGLSMIHASNDRLHQRVIETRLMFARNFRLVGVWSIPGIA